MVVDALNLRAHEARVEAESAKEAIEAVVPTGSLIATARSSAPSGFLLCDGSAVSRTTYAALYEAIGTTYGEGDKSTTFNLPNLAGKFPLGKSGSHALGATGGEENVTLTTEQIPSHSHQEYMGWSSGSRTFPTWDGSTHGLYGAENGAAAGGGKSHTNMPPWQTVNYIIKT